VLSPSTEKVDRVKKLGIYAFNKVGHVWLIHPVNKTLEVLRLDGDTWRILAIHGESDETIRVEPFEAIELPLWLLWSRPMKGEE
jgi:Uma2 family endonuclease